MISGFFLAYGRPCLGQFFFNVCCDRRCETCSHSTVFRRIAEIISCPHLLKDWLQKMSLFELSVQALSIHPAWSSCDGRLLRCTLRDLMVTPRRRGAPVAGVLQGLPCDGFVREDRWLVPGQLRRSGLSLELASGTQHGGHATNLCPMT